MQALFNRIHAAVKAFVVQHISPYFAALSDLFVGGPRMPASCSNIYALLLHLCDGDRALCQWVMRWIAYPLRNPGARMETVLVVNGSQGNGKSLMFETVVAALHGDGARRLRRSDLHAAYNGWIDGATLAIADDAHRDQDVQRLKLLVTAEKILVNQKTVKPRMCSNNLNFIILSSNDEFLPASLGGRRFAVIESPPPQSRLFYQSVGAEIDNCGIEAFRHHLLVNLDMGDFSPSTPMPTAQAHAPALRLVTA